MLSCIVSASVPVLRVNLEEKQKWRLYMTHYLWSQRGKQLSQLRVGLLMYSDMKYNLNLTGMSNDRMTRCQSL